MNPIQCDDPDCLFELECDTCEKFHMVHVKAKKQQTLDGSFTVLAVEPTGASAQAGSDAK
jgi:hypothetical protein